MSNLDKFSDSRDSQLEALFGDLPPEMDTVVALPSEGRFYKNNSKMVTINSIKFEDEKQLASNIKNNENPVNLIISRCVKNVDHNELLLIDKLYLLLRIRSISYGNDYPADITCPKCKAVSQVKINLDNLLVKTIPSELTDPREIILPRLKKVVKVRFPRVSDERYLGDNDQIYSNLWRFVTELNGITDPVFFAKAIPKMHIMDIKFILSNILRPDLGLDPRFIFSCGPCGVDSQLSVPINENFFLVT
jgi:hypothetical protein